ncbi:hypothetical protein SF1_18470 [Sphingobacterium faecium NBRC 15299]|uniref:PRTRC system protein B n=1 Tax=Sphingobacterium faecium TaxID=34087 RepID=UPI000D3F83C1|nr:PRTRC system protein B [Sphingobacterium faecium]PTX09514.1 PRTRC genetic system protein B [Sphingobacterium faecium]GEM63865.1 hypothetical protein SF1_18470 [Sphingobacterium faecium NBRC 15299]
MRAINDITQNFGELYYPVSALVFYQTKNDNFKDTYVEHFEMDNNGNPINAHPLTVLEAEELAAALQTEEEQNKAYLKPKDILSPNILHLNPSKNGSVLWYTNAQKRELFFVSRLGIPNGFAFVPPMVWYATKNSLSVFALSSDERPTAKTPLYYAPYFNIYHDGKVCLGTVNVEIKNFASLEEFTTAWEYYFFNSYFSHFVDGLNSVNGNCIQIWKKLIGTDKPFPLDALKKNNMTLKNLIK